MSLRFVEGHTDVIWYFAVEDFPCIYDHVSFSPSLQGGQLEKFESFPIVHLVAARYSPGKGSLDCLQPLHILDLVWIPESGAVFESAADHGLEQKDHESL